MDPANGPSLTVAHVRAAAARLAPKYGTPLMEGLDQVNFASNLWSFRRFAWMTRVDFTDGVTTCSLTRQKDGNWTTVLPKPDGRGKPLGVVPLDAAFFYNEIRADLADVKNAHPPPPRQRRALKVAAAQAWLGQALSQKEFLAGILTVEEWEGELWLSYVDRRLEGTAPTTRRLVLFIEIINGEFEPADLARQVVAAQFRCSVPTIRRALTKAKKLWAPR